MPIDPRDAPPGYRAAESDGSCHCKSTNAACAFRTRIGCNLPDEFRTGLRRQRCYPEVRKDNVLVVFLKNEEPYGNEED